MRGPSDSISVSQVGGALYFILIKDFWTGLWFLEGASCHPTWFCLLCLACCKSLLLVWPLLTLSRRKEKDGRGSAEDHLLLVTACNSRWENGHVTLHNLLLLRHTSIRAGCEAEFKLFWSFKDRWQWSNRCVLTYNCLSLEGLTAAQLTRMWCYELGNFVFLRWSSFSSIPLAATVKLVAIAHGSASRFCEEHGRTAAIPPRITEMFIKITLYLL